MFLRQSTSQVIRFGPFLDSTDGVTPETALTIAQADMQLSKDGAAFAQKNAAGNATHDTDGWYSTTLDTTDTATTGELKIQINVSGALPVWETYFVLTQSAYDALQTGTFNNLGGTAQTADHTAAIADIPTVAELNARTILSASYALESSISSLNDFNPAVDTVANVTLVATTTTNTDMVGTNNALLAASYTAPDNASITSILADTNELQLNQGDWLTATGFSTLVATDIVTGGAITTVSGDASVDINKINGVTITGDGSANPFDV